MTTRFFSLLLAVALLAAAAQPASAGWWDPFQGVGRYFGYGIGDGYHAKPRRATAAMGGHAFPTYEGETWHEIQPQAAPQPRGRWFAPAPVQTPAYSAMPAQNAAPARAWPRFAPRGAIGARGGASSEADVALPQIEGPEPTLAAPEVNAPEADSPEGDEPTFPDPSARRPNAVGNPGVSRRPAPPAARTAQPNWWAR